MTGVETLALASSCELGPGFSHMDPVHPVLETMTNDIIIITFNQEINIKLCQF